MNLSRWIVVPISAAIVFLIGWGLAALLGLVWAGEPGWVRWGIPCFLALWYLFDAMLRERGR